LNAADGADGDAQDRLGSHDATLIVTAFVALPILIAILTWIVDQ
jgi:hypothetical protein